MPGEYQGLFMDGREPLPECRTEGDFRRHAAQYCYRSDPFGGGWVCTRPPGHRGDHVAHRTGDYGTCPVVVLARWAPGRHYGE